MWNGVNDKIELTSISNHCKEGDRCTLKMSWINNLLVPLNVALLYFTSQLNILYLIFSNAQNRFRIFSNVQNLFRIFSNFQNFQNLFRIFSNVQNLFRFFSEFLVIFRIFRHFSEYLAHKLVYSESLDFVVYRCPQLSEVYFLRKPSTIIVTQLLHFGIL